jgi:hypothetical protein
MIEMVKIICIHEYEYIKEGEIYLTPDDFNSLPIGAIIFVYHECEGYRTLIGGFLKEYFVSLAEWREKQIKTILDVS